MARGAARCLRRLLHPARQPCRPPLPRTPRARRSQSARAAASRSQHSSWEYAHTRVAFTGVSMRIHYAWIVAGITFLALLSSAGIGATRAVLVLPLEREFGWDRAVISLALSINLLLFGVCGPFAG